MTRSKDKGTAAETLVVNYLRSTYWSGAERRALSGGQDKGDITGTPGLCWEVKAAKTLCVPAWLRETEAERVNSGATYATLVIKPQGVGASRVGEWYALMDSSRFSKLAFAVLGSDVGQVYRFETTVRRMKFPVAMELVKFNKSLYGSLFQFGWAEYPGFALMTLEQMAILLYRAGYGSAA